MERNEIIKKALKNRIDTLCVNFRDTELYMKRNPEEMKERQEEFEIRLAEIKQDIENTEKILNEMEE